jgi:phytoene dehydrogenase-like protein
VVVVGAGLAGLSAATRIAEAGRAVTVLERRCALAGEIDCSVVLGSYRALGTFLRRIGASEHMTAEPLDALGGLLGLRNLGIADRVRLAKVAAAIARPSALFPAASDQETVDSWLDRVGQSARARRGFWYPLVEAALADDPRTASARMLEAVLREGFFDAASPPGLWRVTLRPGWAELAAELLESRGGRVVTAVRDVTLEIRGGVVRAVSDGDERFVPTAVVAAVPPRDLLDLVPAEARAGEGYFDALPRLLPPVKSGVVAVRHPAGGEADRPTARSPIAGLFVAGAHARTGLPAHMESAARSGEEAAHLALEFQPLPERPGTTGIVPPRSLVRPH